MCLDNDEKDDHVLMICEGKPDAALSRVHTSQAIGPRANAPPVFASTGCDYACHTFCCEPELDKIPKGDWYCPACKRKRKARRAAR